MAELRRIVWLALVAGVVAGVAATAVQWFTTRPLILEAERYELAAQAGNAAAPMSTGDHAGHAATHDELLSRAANTLVFNVLAGIGFGLVLSAVLSTRAARGPSQGLVLGFAGFVAVSLAPAIGLPPKLPGTATADLLDRQLWWAGTAAASVIGLALLGFGRRAVLKAAGAALLLAPHLVGAPALDYVPPGGPPVSLQSRFIVMSLGASALFWLVLGGLLGWLYARHGDRRIPPAAVGPA
jgi:cobalt transporter subunit CbtA